MILTNLDADTVINSRGCGSSVAYTWRRLHHSATRNYTTEHKLTLPKLLNNMAFNPSLKRMSFETLTPNTHRILADNDYKCSINNKIR